MSAKIPLGSLRGALGRRPLRNQMMQAAGLVRGGRLTGGLAPSPAWAPAGPVIAGGLLSPAQLDQAEEIGCYMYSLFVWGMSGSSRMAKELSGFATARAMFGVGTTDVDRNQALLKGEIPPASAWESVLIYVAANVGDWCPSGPSQPQPPSGPAPIPPPPVPTPTPPGG